MMLFTRIPCKRNIRRDILHCNIEKAADSDATAAQDAGSKAE